MVNELSVGPEHTALRAALWRAMHVQVDASPYVFEDDLGLQLAAPGQDWQQHLHMDPQLTSVFRASVVSRARFIEDLVAEQVDHGLDQYVLLGAGLDTFAQRRPRLAARLTVFEVDQPAPQAWKRQRLNELGFDVGDRLRLVPVDFETDSWWERLTAAGFDPRRGALVASTGVSQYLTREANVATLRQLAQLAPGSTFVTTFMLPLELVASDDEQHVRRLAETAANAMGTPFISFFTPDELIAMTQDAGFAVAEHISADELTARYFTGRTDGLLPAQSEQILVART